MNKNFGRTVWPSTATPAAASPLATKPPSTPWNCWACLRGKQAFSFYERNSGKSVRLVLRPTPDNLMKEEKFHYLQSKAPAELFDVKETVLSLPECARLFVSKPCSCCGELTAESMLRLENGKLVCLDCAHPYHRFDV